MPKKILFYATYGGYGHLARDFGMAKFLTENTEVHIASGMECLFENHKVTFHKLTEIPAISCLDKPIRFTEFYNGTEGPKQYRQHMVEFISLANKLDPDLIVVDVTSEFAVYSKLMGFKTAVVYITGLRKDLRHQIAYSSVDHILVPYPKNFTSVSYLPIEVQRKMEFSGGFSRFDGQKKISREEAKKNLGLDPEEYCVVFSAGKGDFAKKFKETFLASVTPLELKYIILDGNEKEVEKFLSAADLMVTGTGDNSIMETAYFRIPSIVVPLKRPYDEQLIKAHDLFRLGASLYINENRLNIKNLRSIINKIHSHPKIIDKMMKNQAKLVDGEGAIRAANIIYKWA